MRIAVPREIIPGETRVAVIPETVRRFVQIGLEVVVEAGAGRLATASNEEYAAAGATVEADAAAMFSSADMVLKIAKPSSGTSAGRNEMQMLRRGSALVAMLDPAANAPMIQELAQADITSFSLDLVPRITRAQSMDVLTSMSTLTGYKAVLLGADALGRIMPMMMTPAGTIAPARVVIIGAGVAGLQAIATAKRLGAVVKAVDTRPAVREQVESLGAGFIPLEVRHEAQDASGYAKEMGEEFYRQEQEILAPHISQADLIVCTAMIPGRRAPILITEKMVWQMKPGSVIVDLAITGGGNCALSRANERAIARMVTILAPANLPSALPILASQMFSRNVGSFVEEIVRGGKLALDLANEIVRACLVTHQGRITNAAARSALGLEALT
jgi:H+-translocating NAD(P) transhydrogenase subunit alpha